MKLTRENRSTRRETCPSATLSTTNPTWTDPVLFSVPFFFFDPFCTFKSFRPSSCHMFHTSPYTTNTTQTSMPPAGFEPTIPVSGRPQTHAVDRTATGIGRDRTQASAVRGRRLTSWAMARPANDGKFILGAEYLKCTGVLIIKLKSM